MPLNALDSWQVKCTYPANSQLNAEKLQISEQHMSWGLWVEHMELNLFSGVCSGTTSFRAAMWVPCPWHTAKSWERSWTCCCLWLSRRHSGAYSCQNSGHRNYPSLNCVRSQSSTTPSKTSSHISHIPMAHSITAFRLQLLHPPTFRSPRRPQVSQPGSATALLS